MLQATENIDSYLADIAVDLSKLDQRGGPFVVHDFDVTRDFFHAGYGEQYDDHGDDGAECGERKEPAADFEVAEHN
jgi:hypothetical protein